jgi:uncharacterized protein
MLAAQYGNPATVQLLVDEGADLDVRNERSLTAVDFAERRDNPDVRAFLVKVMLDRKRLKKGTW